LDGWGRRWSQWREGEEEEVVRMEEG